jgi:hypothetical protein
MTIGHSGARRCVVAENHSSLEQLMSFLFRRRRDNADLERRLSGGQHRACSEIREQRSGGERRGCVLVLATVPAWLRESSTVVVAPRGWFSSRPRADIRWTEDFRPQIAPSLSRCRTVRSSARGGGRADSPAAKPETGCVRRTALRTRSEHLPNRWGVGRFRRVRVCPGNGEFCETVPDARPPSHGGNPGSNPGSGTDIKADVEAWCSTDFATRRRCHGWRR